MAYSLSPWLKPRFFITGTNRPLAGGLMYTYKAGTIDNATTYSDDAGTPNTNPIVLDSDGQCDLFLDDAVSYRIILKNSAGVTQFDKDRIASLGSTQVQSFNSIAALRLRSGTTIANAANTLRYYSTGDGGGNSFYWDSTSTATDNAGTVIKPTAVSGAGRWLATDASYINVKQFGAVGDGVTDDTAAFVAANTYLMTKALRYSNQTVESNYVTLTIPEGIYKISGHRIFGSQIPTGSNGTAPARMLQILGQGATLIWNVVNEDDELFYFDGTIANPLVQGLSIYTVRSSIISTGAGNIFRFYSNTALTNQANASKLHVVNVSVWPGRYSGGGSGQRPKYIFLNTGNAMCDQMLIEHCRFYYMQKVWVGQNDQAVNITFSSCGFYGASAGTATSTTYFDFTRMNDNFNVVNCSISVMSGETLIKTTSPESGGFFVESAGYNFNFDNNRFEIVSGTSNVSWKLCDMNFGRLNMKNSNFQNGGGSLVVKTVVRAYQLANLNFNNISFNQTDFYFPVAGAAALGGGLTAYGAYLQNCQFRTGTSTTWNYTNGTTDYTLKDVLISTTLYWRTVRFVDCHYLNQNGFSTWEWTSSKSDISLAPRKTETVSFSRGGLGFGQKFTLPPYQVIKKITVSLQATLPETYEAFRVWIGDRTIGTTFDVDNIMPGYRKNEYLLFEGDAVVFYDDLTLQSIEVALLNSGVEANTINSHITLEYGSMDSKSLNLTTTSDVVRFLRNGLSLNRGATSQRPNVGVFFNQQFWDSSVNKPIWANQETVVTTGSITSGTPTLTVASGAGIANGNNISVTNAGAAGAALVTTVLSGGGTTTLTLAANATTTVSSVAVTANSWKDATGTTV